MTVIDGKIVWNLHATHGLPVEVSLELLARCGLVPSWDRLLTAAQADGTNIARLKSRLSDAIADAYPAHAAVMIPKLEKL
jgi:alanyl-tRNA synthetase